MRFYLRRNKKFFKPLYVMYFAILGLVLALLSCNGSGSPPTFTVSGTITAPVNAAVDSDVNDIGTPYNPSLDSNDSFSDAQSIPNPVILGGFVNLSLTGDHDGRFWNSGDTKDFYSIQLMVGDKVTIYIADEEDLDLFLYNDTQGEEDSSTGENPSETVTAPSDGNFYVEVRAITGASNYTLIISPTTTGANVEALNLNDDFVPGDIIVKFRDNAQSMAMSHGSSVFGMTHKRGRPGKAQLFTVEDDTQVEAVFDALSVPKNTRKSRHAFNHDKITQRKFDTLNIIRVLRKRDDVLYAEPNYIRQPLAVPNDTHYHLQWHYDLIYLPEAWDISSSVTDEVIVAVIDTGILPSHPDLTNRITSDGWDFVDGDADPTDPGDNPGAGSSFHGTHVAGTIAAETDNALGVAGVGWNTTRIMPIRVLDENGGTSENIANAVLYAAGLDNSSNHLPSQRADIINLSLGGGSFSAEEADAFELARDEGVIIVAAAGNSASSQPIYPAALDGVISVSAVDYNTSLAYYSSFGATIDVAAPGGDTTVDLNKDGYPDGVLSTLGDDSSGVLEDDMYGFYQGTSMASPHMAGVAALMSAVSPTISPDDLDAWLINGDITIDLGSTGRDNYYGYGLIDAHQAVLAAQNGTVPAVLRITPSWLGFGSTISSATLLTEEIGGPSGTIVISGVTTPDPEWLSIDPDDVDPKNGLGTYTVMVDRDFLSGQTGYGPGSYSSTITFESGVTPAVEIPVSVEVKGVDESADAGYHYVLLINVDTGNVYQTSVGVASGVYNYSFSGIPAGSYFIIAGTDFDNDYLLGDPGEAIGAYLSLDQPVSFTINGNRSDLDFYTELNVNIPETLLSSNGTAGFPINYRLPDKPIKR